MLNEETRQQLKKRNLQFVAILLKKIEEVCPGAVDLIGIGGSFCNGDYHEKSDLDLMIIANDKKAKAIDLCFILEDTGHDFYASNWEMYEKKTSYADPYVTKLVDLDIVYVKNAAALERYISLQDALVDNMKNGGEKIKKNLQFHYAQAKEAFSLLKKTKSQKEGYLTYSKILSKIEFVLYMHNKSYVKRGLKRIPEEIARLKKLPEGFMSIYDNAVDFHSLEEATKKAEKMLDLMDDFLKENGYNISKKRIKKRPAVEKNPLCADALTGMYEEMFSNYYNKMHHAVDIESKYLSFRALADAQAFYEEFAAVYEVEELDFIGKFNPDDLQSNAKTFDDNLTFIAGLYKKFEKPVCRFESLEDFKRRYLAAEEKSAMQDIDYE